MNVASDTARRVATLIASVWCGLILGVSFIATPVKFTAPLINFKEALDLGRVTFGLFGPVEVAMSILLLGAVLLASRGRSLGLLPVIAGLCLAITLGENFLLRPLLDERLLAVLADRPLPESRMHLLYVLSQAVKLPMLLALAVVAGRRTGEAFASGLHHSLGPGIQQLQKLG
ncbi:hypothetical protein [Pelagibius sp. Alg239-R121]|uniref:hypothetical protein n=1 Tax=Pelagibius sp. Alg239-R121 TaxID=2993448 RepID=UPI0024A74B53|nr:hypothetical protein [Pelagibius sp. Alg239-R121]